MKLYTRFRSSTAFRVRMVPGSKNLEHDSLYVIVGGRINVACGRLTAFANAAPANQPTS